MGFGGSLDSQIRELVVRKLLVAMWLLMASVMLAQGAETKPLTPAEQKTVAEDKTFLEERVASGQSRLDRYMRLRRDYDAASDKFQRDKEVAQASTRAPDRGLLRTTLGAQAEIDSPRGGDRLEIAKGLERIAAICRGAC